MLNFSDNKILILVIILLISIIVFYPNESNVNIKNSGVVDIIDDKEDSNMNNVEENDNASCKKNNNYPVEGYSDETSQYAPVTIPHNKRMNSYFKENEERNVNTNPKTLLPDENNNNDEWFQTDIKITNEDVMQGTTSLPIPQMNVLKNANQQIRDEPPNPKLNGLSPWMISSYGPPEQINKNDPLCLK